MKPGDIVVGMDGEFRAAVLAGLGHAPESIESGRLHRLYVFSPPVSAFHRGALQM